jgi:SRSO17 transposase
MEVTAMTHANDAQRWAAQLDDLCTRLAPRFGRIEPRRRARAYLQGLLAPLERKNGWQLAEAAGDATPDGVHDFLSRMHWDADAVRDDLRAYGVAHLGDPEAVLVLDETGFLKKGSKSVGVKRQYSGTAGRIENCQIGVFLAYASRHGHALIDRALYLPETWAGDAARRAEAGVPESVGFATKPKLGQAMLARAFAAGVPCRWVVGDSVYGSDHQTRRLIEAHGRGYVLTVTSAQRLGLKPVADWLEDVPAKGWKRLSAGDGAKGPRLYDWAYLPYGRPPPGWTSGLLIRRRTGRPHQFTFYLTWAPADTSLATLVRVAGKRWTVETCFEEAKGETGLDQYEVRSWTGWHRHITLSLLAHAYLTVVRQHAIGGRSPCRRGGRTVAAHRAGGPTPAVASGLGETTRSRSRAALVRLATASSVARATLPLAQTHQTSM